MYVRIVGNRRVKYKGENMNLFFEVLLWGVIIGIIHFIVVGFLYQNPIISKIYKDNGDHSGVKKWNSQQKYILSMFLGTQIEIFIMTIGYIVFRNALGVNIINTLIIALIFTGVRIYPRFWNMWIQSTYPNRLLRIELVNGTISTFVVVFGLYFLPV